MTWATGQSVHRNRNRNRNRNLGSLSNPGGLRGGHACSRMAGICYSPLLSSEKSEEIDEA